MLKRFDCQGLTVPRILPFESMLMASIFRNYVLLGSVAVLCVQPAPASAETLREALVKAYQTNPTLTGARAGQRG
jgi:hypothetical protein